MLAKLRSLTSVFGVFLKLGLTSFGGPIAHIGYFHNEFVVKRRWVDEADFADLVALAHFLPGPSSSQVGFAIGVTRDGIPGACAAWLGFTLPSALLMALCVHFLGTISGVVGDASLHGLALAAIAVVALAVFKMTLSLSPDLQRVGISIASLALATVIPGFAGQAAALIFGGITGYFFFNSPITRPDNMTGFRISRSAANICLACWLFLLVGLPCMTAPWSSNVLANFERFYRAGTLVFGGGHVVLPFLQSAFVETGIVDAKTFLSGYGAAQALPGPLFTFAAFLGGLPQVAPTGWVGSLLAIIAIFLPGLLLMISAMHYWDDLRLQPKAQALLFGVNSAVVGLLAAALLMLASNGALRSASDIVLTLLAFGLLAFVKMPPWMVVALCALAAPAIKLLNNA